MGEDLYKTEKISHKSPGKCTSEWNFHVKLNL